MRPGSGLLCPVLVCPNSRIRTQVPPTNRRSVKPDRESPDSHGVEQPPAHLPSWPEPGDRPPFRSHTAPPPFAAPPPPPPGPPPPPPPAGSWPAPPPSPPVDPGPGPTPTGPPPRPGIGPMPWILAVGAFFVFWPLGILALASAAVASMASRKGIRARWSGDAAHGQRLETRARRFRSVSLACSGIGIVLILGVLLLLVLGSTATTSFSQVDMSP